MIGIVLLTHGNLGQSLIEAVELIAGKQEKVAALGLKHGDGVGEFEKKCAALINEMSDGDGLIAFVDFVGGTPANTALKCMREKAFPCIAGVNMPMLLEAAMCRNTGATPQELEKMCLVIGTESLTTLRSFLKGKNLTGEMHGEDF